ncbi:MAG: Crp/Fnr family transcriptional regulator [Bacteroidales bacterium]|nr:Crp/Fnr family transcriptional regulator [Bacteroidales bacterium]
MTSTDNKQCGNCKLKELLCRGLSAEDLTSLVSQAKLRRYKKGDVILQQGVKCTDLIYLSKGIVKFILEDNCREFIVTIDKAQTLIGLANILNEDINYFTVRAATECTGCAINLSRFKLLMLNNRNFMFEIMSLSTQMFRGAINNFISIARKQSNGRVADVLLYLSEKIYESPEFSLSFSRQELADFAGCSKEQIIHTLRNFASDNIISASGKKIEILDIERLKKISRIG